MLRVLIVHNAYQQRGGEDTVVEAEIALLRVHGHEVEVYTRHNDEINHISEVAILVQTLWSSRTVNDIRLLINQFKPDVMHVHNTFPLISPAVYWVAARAGVPVIQTLHNFRLMCPQAMFLWRNRICEDCLGKLPWRGVMRRCYHGSAAQSAALAGMLTVHRAMGTYRHQVTRYIAMNEFCRGKFIEGGIPSDKIAVKPNFVAVPQSQKRERRGGLFVGRFSPEKGIDVLLGALEHCGSIIVRMVGAGPEAHKLNFHPGIIALGWKNQHETLEEMQRAAYLIMPSLWYENFPRTLVEAFACGLAVIASRLGAMAELIEDGRTGLLFEPGSIKDLAQKIKWAEENPEAMLEMGRHARAVYESKYTPEKNYEQLLSIYSEAVYERQ